MRRLVAVCLWDLTLAVRNRFLQALGLVAVMGGTVLLSAAPGPETLSMVLIQALLFFGSLLAFLVGWGSGQRAREEGAFLFAQPISAGELVVGKTLGTGSWCLLLLLLFMGPAILRAGVPGTLLALGALTIGYTLVCLIVGLFIGLVAPAVSGLLAVLLAWVVVVAGWELGLLVLSDAGWIEHVPWLFVTLLLINPAGMYRIGALVGLDSVPFDTSELETGRIFFEHIWGTAAVVFSIWIVGLLTLTIWRVGREEF